MLAYLRELDRDSDRLSLEIIGQSVEGRDIPALFFSNDKIFGIRRAEKPVVLIFGQQHGDEPSGKEGALVIARQLLKEKRGILQNLDLILVPQVNPDGAEKEQRRNANDRDLNRNHAILSEPESQALHQLFLKWMPEVTLDVHEYSSVSQEWVSRGFIKDADEQLGKLSNLNISKEILDFSRDTFIPGVGRIVTEAGFSYHEYVVGTPFNKDQMRFSTTAINDGRQSFGIYQTFSFILEGKQFADVLTGIQRRTEGQVAGITAFLQIVAQNSRLILEIIQEARRQLVDQEYLSHTRSYLQMDYFVDSTRTEVTFPVFNLLDWRAEKKKLGPFHARVGVKKSVKKPLAYLIPASHTELLEILARHRIEMNPLPKPTTLEVEAYQIYHVTSTIEEDQVIPYVDLEVRTINKEFPMGSVVIYLTQPAASLIPLLLEPQSTFSLYGEGSGQNYRLENYLKENSEFPIYRILQPIKIHQVKGKFN